MVSGPRQPRRPAGRAASGSAREPSREPSVRDRLAGHERPGAVRKGPDHRALPVWGAPGVGLARSVELHVRGGGGTPGRSTSSSTPVAPGGSLQVPGAARLPGPCDPLAALFLLLSHTRFRCSCCCRRCSSLGNAASGRSPAALLAGARPAAPLGAAPGVSTQPEKSLGPGSRSGGSVSAVGPGFGWHRPAPRVRENRDELWRERDAGQRGALADALY